MTVAPDPRPLIGEPLPLDLINTCWIDDAGPQDLLARPDGLAVWLASAGLEREVEASPGTLAALLETREALLAVADGGRDGGPAAARELLNDTLRHGRVLRLLGDDGPVEVVETDSPDWVASWRAAEHYLRLLAAHPDRIRTCADHACVLRFYDVSKAGTRRWCSMAACGNRAKARSHYARQRGAAGPRPTIDG